jgi:hypothetical protein
MTGDAEASGRRAAECRSSICSLLACVQAVAAARVADKGGFREAIERDDVAAVQDYLIADASCVSKVIGYDWTTLSCHFLFAILIFCSFSHGTPLYFAARQGNVEVVQLLLSCKAAVDKWRFQYRPYPCIVDDNTLLLIFCCIVPLILLPDFLLL